MIELMSQQEQQGESHQGGFDMNQGGMNPNNFSAASMLRSQQSPSQQLQQQQQMPNNANFGITNQQMAAMFQQQQHQQQQQQHMQQQGGMQGGMGNQDQQQQQQQLPPNFDIQNEIKRIQQLHQFSSSAPGAPGNGLLLSSQGSQDPSAFLQSMLDQQKVQAPRFDNPLGGSTNLFQPGFLNDARFLMAQNQLNAATLQQQARPEVPLPSPHSLFHRDGSRRMRGGVIEPFPEKLHRLLVEVEAAGRSDVISWVANGRAFAIHKPDKFFKDIVPLYFRQSRLSSFKRQLNLYGFELINSGPARGGYFHDLFVKDQPELCRRMRRVAVKVGSKESHKEDKELEGKGDEDKIEGHLPRSPVVKETNLSL
jgi:hypothetical protein